MKNFVFAVCILLCIISLSQSRRSFYYSDKGTSGYHPPYDFIDYNNNGETSCSPLCNATTEVIQTNSNYTQVNSGQCSNVPDFFSQQNQLPNLSFDSCCSLYQTCAQTCGNTKEYCDQQFYGCIWNQCGATYVVRPGDRFICRSYATCYASWNANNMTCDQFNFYQSQACVCVPTGGAVPLPSPSSSPSASFSVVPSASVSPSIGASLSSSPIPTGVGKRQDVSPSSSYSSEASLSSSPSSFQDVSTSTINDNSAVAGYSDENYVSRPVPAWSNIYNQCPPTIGNYINVMSDQEMDDITMWNSGSSLKMWWDLF